MNVKDALTPILLVVLIFVVMVGAAIQQQSARETQDLLRELNEKLATAAGPAEPSPGAAAVAEPTLERPTPRTPTPPASAIDQPAAPAGPPGITPRPSPEPAIPEPAPAAATTAPAPVAPTTTSPPAASADAGPIVDVAPAAPDQSPDLADLDWEAYGPTVEWTVRNLLSGNDDLVYAKFGGDLKALTLRELTASMNVIREKHGRFRSIESHTSPTVRLPDGWRAFRVTVQTERESPLQMTITLNQDKQIVGLF